MADPRLWTGVQIHGTSPMYRLHLERSRPLLLDITILCTGQVRGVVADFVQRELSHPDCQREMVRLRSLRLVAWSDEELNQLVSPLQGLDLPHLASLHVEIAGEQANPPMSLQWWAHRHSHSPLLTAHTPILSSISLVNKCTDCLGETSRLTKLELHSFPGPFDCTVLERVIQASPCLDTLELGELDFLWHQQRESASVPVDTSQIKRLSVASSIFSKGMG